MVVVRYNRLSPVPMMLALKLVPAAKAPLAEQIVDAIRLQIDRRDLRTGSRLPSIRVLAASYGVSPHTAVEAYDRLVALGYLVARRGAGFFVADHALADQPDLARRFRDLTIFNYWFPGSSTDGPDIQYTPGSSRLMEAWADNAGLLAGMRALSRHTGAPFGSFDDLKGYKPLRIHLSRMLHDVEIDATPDQVLLTFGSAHAHDLIVRSLLQPGDRVFVEDPGCFNVKQTLRTHGVVFSGIPRTRDGIDIAALEARLKQSRPKLMFVNPSLQNPTGTCYSTHQMHRLLQLCEQHRFLIVEDDSHAALQVAAPSLAAMDRLDRIIYLSSFSRSISSSIRVGYIAAADEIIETLVRLKMVNTFTTSEVNERLVYQVLTSGKYRKHIDGLRARLSQAQRSATEYLERLGFELFHEPPAGLFLWAKHPRQPDSAVLAGIAAKRGIWLAPGHLFMTDGQACPWSRFNAAFCKPNAVFESLFVG